MDEAEAAEVLAALDSLEQAMLTQSDPLTGFADLLSRTPGAGAFKNDYHPKSCLSTGG